MVFEPIQRNGLVAKSPATIYDDTLHTALFGWFLGAWPAMGISIRKINTMITLYGIPNSYKPHLNSLARIFLCANLELYEHYIYICLNMVSNLSSQILQV